MLFHRLLVHLDDYDLPYGVEDAGESFGHCSLEVVDLVFSTCVVDSVKITLLCGAGPFIKKIGPAPVGEQRGLALAIVVIVRWYKNLLSILLSLGCFRKVFFFAPGLQ